MPAPTPSSSTSASGPATTPSSRTSIEALLVDRARAGRSVVRLKGGDPFVFGRGGEEAEALAAAGIDFEVVPGVTAGVAAPAYAGIPVTHRDDASAVAFVTGHEDPAKPETALDWEALARFPGTLVLYMGVKNLPLIAERLAAAGRDPAEPAAAIERGTLAGQRTVTATLAELPAAVAEAGLGAPAILLFGSVAARRDSIAWIERRPLWGRTRGGHARPRPGERPGGDVAGPGRRGRRAAGDPDRAAPRHRRRARRGRRPAQLRGGGADEPERRSSAVRGDGRARPRRARARERAASPRSARAPRGRWPRTA